MPNEINYYDTTHTFISPVRHFKANDPYYFEVDNIPVKQLEESQKFLKDQVDGLIQNQPNADAIEIGRSGFSELKPFALGTDRKVRVKPGRFTARINNGYSLTTIQTVTQATGFGVLDASGPLDLNSFDFQTNIGQDVSSALFEFSQGRLGDALNMNGLAERTFVHPVWDDDGFIIADRSLAGSSVSGTTTPGYAQFDSDFSPESDQRPLFPNFIGALYKNSTPELQRRLRLINNVFDSEPTNAGSMGRMESEFIKRWRGTIRTAIVDVAEELDITVPEFDADDFFCIQPDGTRLALDANNRIDLLFIYSKAIDESQTTISKFDANGNPTTLLQPSLGILKGAGIGVSRKTSITGETPDDRVNLQSLDGTPLMLAHPGDFSGNNTGISSVNVGLIKGSFPSPDDLMNLAPLLSEQLESTAFQLIGQSILPIAYIRVQNEGGPIADIINNDDIIDIRPFFRTTELAYNERAGIAAATPQVSIANPVVTEAYFEKTLGKTVEELSSRISEIQGNNSSPPPPPNNPPPNGERARVIAAGSVLGGYWGPEGALLRHAKSNIGNGIELTPINDLIDKVEQEFGYVPGSIPFFPNWDFADWKNNGPFTDHAINDHINIGYPRAIEEAGPQGLQKWMPPWKGLPGVTEFVGGDPETVGSNLTLEEIRNELGFTAFNMYNFATTEVADDLGLPAGIRLTDPLSQEKREIAKRNVQINFVRKRIQLDFTETPWVTDYQVKVNLLHCLPLSEGARTFPVETPATAAGMRNGSCVWVQKFKDYFTICVAWAGKDITPLTRGGLGTFPEPQRQYPWVHRNDSERFAGFAMPNFRLMSNPEFSTGGVTPAGFSVNINSTERQDLFDLIFNGFGNRLSSRAVNPGGIIPETDAKFTRPDYFTTVAPIVYPSVQFEVIGLSSNLTNRSFGSNGALMRSTDPTIICT
tara:strand:- start:4958 stop:7750 length:2793 start_codon:yes stop_codon:yes gene_type:complete